MPHPRAPAPTVELPRRSLILSEALRIVGDRGYHGFSIQELADRCGLTKAGLLHHFGSKDRLLVALLAELDVRYEAEMIQLVEGEHKPTAPEGRSANFRAALRNFVERSLTEPEFIRLRVVLRVEAINSGHPAHEYFVARERDTLMWLAERTANLSKRPTSTARQIMAMMAGLEEQWLREEGRVDLLDEWDQALRTLLPD